MDAALLELLYSSLLYGSILSLLVCALLLAGAYLNPEIMLRGYPPQIKAHYGEGSANSKRQRVWLGLLVASVLFSIIALAQARVAQLYGEVRFLPSALCVFVIFLTLNIVDLLINDWLIFNTLRPHFIVLRGTEGLAGYRDYAFHFKQFLKGVCGSAIASPAIAALGVLVDGVL